MKIDSGQCMVSEKVNCYGGYHPVCGAMLCCTYIISEY